MPFVIFRTESTIFKRDEIKNRSWDAVLNNLHILKNHYNNSAFLKLLYSHLLVILGSAISKMVYLYY